MVFFYSGADFFRLAFESAFRVVSLAWSFHRLPLWSYVCARCHVVHGPPLQVVKSRAKAIRATQSNTIVFSIDCLPFNF